MHEDNTHIIVGPPGTGKTTRLIGIVEGLLESGFGPTEICYCAFTRKAATEARDRSCTKLNFTTDQLPWFRTLHSLAFHQLGLSKAQVMGFGDYVKIAQELGLFITLRGLAEDGTISGLSVGDRLFFMENMSRAQLLDLKTYWEKFPDEDIYWYQLQQLQQTVLNYKKAYGKQDFTDIITMFCNNPVVPNLRALIIDEAQDLTPLQWKMVEHLSENVEEVYVAGDDDQAIFRWAGAAVQHFIDLPGSREVLPQSYRVPSAIQEVATGIARQIDGRIPKDWNPTKEVGIVDYANDISHIDMSTGTWYLLARNVYLLQAYNDHCMQMGYVFDSHIGSPVKGNSLKAIVDWEKLRKGEHITGAQAKTIYDLLGTKVGVAYGFKTKLDKLDDNCQVTMAKLRADYGLLTEKIWHEALDKLDPAECQYFLAALQRGEKLLKEPRIKINTIHGVKGGEADHVVIQTDMAQRTFNEYKANPDDEHRVWYVAVTRAKQSLHIITPKTDRTYQI